MMWRFCFKISNKLSSIVVFRLLFRAIHTFYFSLTLSSTQKQPEILKNHAKKMNIFFAYRDKNSKITFTSP